MRARHSCALRATTTGSSADCWGDNRFGQLGGGWPARAYDTPQPVALRIADRGADYFKVSAGASHTCALKVVTTLSSTVPAGAVLCWGNNRHGQVGQNYQQIWDSPTNVRGP